VLIKVFRIGPVSLLPLIILWGAVCYRIGSLEAYDWWREYPFAVMVVVALLWHLALIAVGKDRLLYSVCALAHFPIFLFATFLAYMAATRAPWF
jgi:hypothetical protein